MRCGWNASVDMDESHASYANEYLCGSVPEQMWQVWALCVCVCVCVRVCVCACVRV